MEKIYGLSVKYLKIKTMQFPTEYDWKPFCGRFYFDDSEAADIPLMHFV